MDYSPGMSSQRQAFRDAAADVVRRIQGRICDALEEVEREGGGTARFRPDEWTRPAGGGGVSRVLLDGQVIEKGGVNVSVVHGKLEGDFARQLPGTGDTFFATGVSLVIHPRSPHLPTSHANFRYIEHGERRWFGGGGDLTPYYWDEDDEAHFHGVWKAYCDAHAEHADYERLRDWCDRYFFLQHRGERRGVGGIFFDDLVIDEARPGHADALLEFIEEGGTRFIEAYVPILRRHMHEPVTPEQRRWQELRRGRYVEFNLLYDRGTVFGLKTGGRIESILMSLPPRVQWGYCEEPEPGTPEARLLERVRRPPPAQPSGTTPEAR
jgi:coproporphyrinogen III oxidase